MTRLTIYGDAISGNCLKVKWTADALGLDYDWVETSVLDRKTRTPEFLERNPAGQVPVVTLADGRSLAQSNAIILYLNDVHGGAFVPEDAYARAKVLEWLFWEQYSHEPAIAVRRFQKFFQKKSDDAIDPLLMKKGVAALERLEDALSVSLFLVGDSVTLADIALIAYTREAPSGGFDLEAYPRIKAWIARVEKTLDIPPVECA
ncbi:MAG: glutathione S-transferase family protein [Pseudomonadota bacterium]